jgi:hypothetical protein
VTNGTDGNLQKGDSDQQRDPALMYLSLLLTAVSSCPSMY